MGIQGYDSEHDTDPFYEYWVADILNDQQGWFVLEQWLHIVEEDQ